MKKGKKAMESETMEQNEKVALVVVKLKANNLKIEIKDCGALDRVDTIVNKPIAEWFLPTDGWNGLLEEILEKIADPEKSLKFNFIGANKDKKEFFNHLEKHVEKLNVHLAGSDAFAKFLKVAGKVPGVAVKREKFLRKAFEKVCKDPEQLEKIIQKGPRAAGIPVEQINEIANHEIGKAVASATTISFVTGLPGGLAMLATVPADLLQFYAHAMIILQKLMYLYIWDNDIFDEDGNMDEATEQVVIVMFGVMFGVKAAATTLAKLVAQIGGKSLSKVTANAITKALIKGVVNKTTRPLIVKIIQKIGLRSTLMLGHKLASKIVPLIGGFASAALTLAFLPPMANLLKNKLANLEDEAKKVADTVTEGDDVEGEFSESIDWGKFDLDEANETDEEEIPVFEE